MSNVMYVIAHRAGARLVFQNGTTIEAVETIDHPEGRTRNADHDSDRAGRTHDSSGRRHGLGRHETATDHVAATFALELARRVNDRRLKGAYDRAVLVAEPSFLGLLRGALDDATAKTITSSLAKDLSSVETSQLPERLREALPEAFR